jgi:DnaJ-class molecular chaperone
MILLRLLLCLLYIGGTVAAKKCLYKILGAPRGKQSSPDDLKKAYRKACLKHHPDKGGDEETFKELSSAYEVLSDPEMRQRYDQFGDAGIHTGGGAPPPNFGTNVPPQFNTHNGGSGFFGMDPRMFGSAAQQNTNIDLSDVLRQMMGDQFAGQQQQPPPFVARNPQFGRQETHRQPPPTYERPFDCALEDLYNGTLKRLKVTLGGRSRVYPLKIKKGWKAGTKVKFPATREFPYAITFIVREKKHPLFDRRGDHLFYRHVVEKKKDNAPVQLDITLLDGTVWSRIIPARSSLLRPGQSLTLPGMGMPIKGGPERGDLIVEFR